MQNEPELNWYVVEARDGAVRLAQLNLAVAFSRYGDGSQVWVPNDHRRSANRSRSGSRRADYSTPRFGRFIFIRCRMTHSLRHAIKDTAGVVDVLHHAGNDTPTPIPDSVIAYLKENPTGRRKGDYVIGDTIRVKEGPFASFSGKVTRVDSRGVLVADIVSLGRPTPVVLEVGHVEMVLLAKSRSIETLQGSRAKRRAGLQRNGAKSAA